MTKKWRCTVCGYIHEGDTPPEKCPLCGVDASQFELMEEKAAENNETTVAIKEWRCKVCGYIRKGEVPPEKCPLCGVDASNFELISEDSSKVATKEVTLTQPSALTSDKRQTIIQSLFRFSYGMYIITAHADGKDNGQCANTCFQITAEPERIAIAINKSNYTHELIEQSGTFGLSVLNQKGHDYVRGFGYRSGRGIDKFEGVSVHRGQFANYLLDDALVTIEGKIINKMDAGTHTVYLADVVDATIQQEGEPMTYAYFRATK